MRMRDKNKTKPTYEILPLDPEKNPPENIEDLEILINKLLTKSSSIKQQLEVVTLREKQCLPVDYNRVKRAIFARTQTNKSIAALQCILKKRRQQLALKSATSFEKFFFEAAKDKLSSEQLTDIMQHTFVKMKELEHLSCN